MSPLLGALLAWFCVPYRALSVVLSVQSRCVSVQHQVPVFLGDMARLSRQSRGRRQLPKLVQTQQCPLTRPRPSYSSTACRLGELRRFPGRGRGASDRRVLTAAWRRCGGFRSRSLITLLVALRAVGMMIARLRMTAIGPGELD